jgi:hypothetical protein
VWWIEAERVSAVPDTTQLRSLVTDLFEQHWPARVNRAAGSPGERVAGGLTVPAGAQGVVYRTQRFPLFPGVARVTSSHRELDVRVVDADGGELAAGVGGAVVELTDTAFGVSVELVASEPLGAALRDPRVDVAVEPAATQR